MVWVTESEHHGDHNREAHLPSRKAATDGRRINSVGGESSIEDKAEAWEILSLLENLLTATLDCEYESDFPLLIGEAAIAHTWSVEHNSK